MFVLSFNHQCKLIFFLSVLLNTILAQGSWRFESEDIVFPGPSNENDKYFGADLKHTSDVAQGRGSSRKGDDSKNTSDVAQGRGASGKGDDSKRTSAVAQGRGSTGKGDRNPSTKRRLCERKYSEFIERIFPDESDTAIDANDSEFNGRILASPGEYPHMTALGFVNDNEEIDYKCGGSLISEKFVITAAHCANISGMAPTKARIGDLNLMVEETYLEPQMRDIKTITIHPNYTSRSYYNDIALCELETEVELTEYIRPIRLWTRPRSSFKTAFAMGYGATDFARERSNRLTDLNMTIVSNDECNRAMPAMPEAARGIIESQICAQDFALQRDTCQGDSGGPLQLNIRGRRRRNRLHYYLIGITSYGLFCRSPNPSVYTRVYSFLDWIEQIVWEDDIE